MHANLIYFFKIFSIHYLCKYARKIVGLSLPTVITIQICIFDRFIIFYRCRRRQTFAMHLRGRITLDLMLGLVTQPAAVQRQNASLYGASRKISLARQRFAEPMTIYTLPASGVYPQRQFHVVYRAIEFPTCTQPLLRIVCRES